ncbi:MAG: DNA polymerase III subunit beta [Bryobacter sp.]|nr:DNA polymerase III subunit beta [Bryobacter sp.]
MEFTVKQSDLVKELNLSQGVVEKKTTIPILSNILIETGDGAIHLTATDLELGIRCSCPARITKAGSGTLPARRLLDYIRLLPDQDVTFKFMDNQWANITCGRSKSRIAGMSRESYPQLPTMPEPMGEIPAGIFSGMIAKTIFAISNEESRFTLNGAQMLIASDKLTMVATDGHRLSLAEYPVEGLGAQGAYKTLLPKKAMQEILKLSADAEAGSSFTFSGDDNHLFFAIGDRLLISRKLTGNFPDFEKVLPKTQTHRVQLSKEETKSTVQRVSQFSEERSRAIRLQFAEGEMKVFSSMSDTGESEETIPVAYNGPAVDIGFNAQYILDFLGANAENACYFLFNDAQSAGELRPATTATEEESSAINYTYRYVVMPMRI